MEDKIEVGEYVRIDKSSRFLGIGKVIGIVGNTIYLKMYIDLPISFSEEEIKECKHLKNIIDLIEVGDYVNGIRILDITGNYIHTVEFDCCKSRLERKIKSIVTKEQFKSIEYKVEEEKDEQSR